MDERKVHSLLAQFVEDYHKSLIRSWTSFLNKPVFLKGSDVRSLSVDQIVSEFQRDVGYFQIDVEGEVEGSFYWFFEFKQMLLFSSLMLLQNVV